MGSKRKYSRTINGNTYWVSIDEGWLWSSVAVRGYSFPNSEKYAKGREWFCDSVERLAARVLSEAVHVNEKRISNRQERKERLEQALDVVVEEYDNE